MVLKECFTLQGDDIRVYSLTPEEIRRQSIRDYVSSRKGIIISAMNRLLVMKSTLYIQYIRQACRFIGFAMMLMMSAILDSSATAIIVWLSVSIILLLIGKSFSFQKLQ